MNWVDALLALLILLSVWAGIRRGVFLAGADLFALAASLVCAFHLYPYAVHLAEQQGLQWGVWTPPAAFLLVYIVVRIALGALFIRSSDACRDRYTATGRVACWARCPASPTD